MEMAESDIGSVDGTAASPVPKTGAREGWGFDSPRFRQFADVAPTVELPPCKRLVVGSNPTVGSIHRLGRLAELVRHPAANRRSSREGVRRFESCAFRHNGDYSKEPKGGKG